MIYQWPLRSLLVFTALSCLALDTSAAVKRGGAEIYRETCAKCHGPNGEGVADKHDEPLYGDRSLSSLSKLIDRTMPEDDPDALNAEDSAKVAAYIYDVFYSPQARAKINPARVELSRLTVEQYLNSVADIIGSFRASEPLGTNRGLAGQYHKTRNFRRNGRAFERVDPAVNFDFGTESPTNTTNSITTNEFAIKWRGSLIVEETGDYEFKIKTENGARLWLNNEKKALIDEWVSSGQVREHKETIRLLGGRAYPIQVDYFKYKDKTASIVLQWRPPHKTWRTIPVEHLTPQRVPEVFVVKTAFPADDSSAGYPRGTAVSKAWDQATTYAAIDVAGYVVDNLEALSGIKATADHRDEHLKNFCEKFGELAFRRPLSDEEKTRFVQRQFADNVDTLEAVRRSILLILKSPRFLYPELGRESDSYAIASRLSLALWDSGPDKELMAAARENKLSNAAAVREQAQRMLKDPRAKTKMHDFFAHWLEMHEAEDLSKDRNAYPDFDDDMVADLRTSLELFIDGVVWSEKSDYRELLLADYLLLNEPLAKFYGADIGDADGFEKIAFEKKKRSGILTHPYLLSAFAYHKSSSPIHRGVFLTRNVVGRALKPPPMAIEFMDGRFDPSLTMREKVSELTRPAACQSCHSVINPLGFSLENFDAVGRYRTTENKKPIDPTGEYTTADGKTIQLKGARDLAKYAAESPEAHRGFVRQLFQQMVKQSPDAFGAGTLEQLRKSFAASDYNIQKLVVEIAVTTAVRSEPETKLTKAGN